MTEEYTISVKAECGCEAVFDNYDDFMKSVVVDEESGQRILLKDEAHHVIGSAEGPALVFDGAHGRSEEWLRYGKAHRDGDEPAFISPILKMWYKDGKRHRDQEFGPAVEFESGIQEYWQHGALHRADGPAVIQPNKDNQYYLEGQRLSKLEHSARTTGRMYVRVKLREGDEGVIAFKNPEEYIDAWFQDDEGRFWIEVEREVYSPESESGTHMETEQFMVHSEHEPALIWPDGSIEWLYEGKAHREDGPAVEDENGWQYWYKHGQLHRDGDQPALITNIVDNGELVFHHEWYKDGQRHRENGPAEIFYDEYGEELSRAYWINGVFQGAETMEDQSIEKLTPEQALQEKLNAVFAIGTDGKQVQIACNQMAFEQDVFQDDDGFWYINGRDYARGHPDAASLDGDLLIHRDDGFPAVVYSDGHQEWLHRGLVHREDGPAVIYPDGTQEWWVEGMLHREHGPARIHADGQEEYWLFDEQVEKSQTLADNSDEEATLDNKERVGVKVKIKSTQVGQEQFTSLYFFSVEEYTKSCYRDDEGRYRIKLGKWIDALVHCDDGPAVEYDDGKVAYVVDGNSVDKSVVLKNKEAKNKENAQIVVADDNRDEVFVETYEALWDNYLVEDFEGRIRWKDTGDLLSNRFGPAINYRDGSQTFIVNGNKVDKLALQIENGSGYKIEYNIDWTELVDGGFDCYTTQATAWLDTENFDTPVWKVEVGFENIDFIYQIQLPFVSLNTGAPILHPITTKTGLDAREAFCTGQFIHNFLIDLMRHGPDVLNTALVKEEYRQDFRTHLWDALEPLKASMTPEVEKEEVPPADVVQEDTGFGFPLACLAIAGLAGIAANNKKGKKKKLKNKPVQKKQEVVEEAYAVAR